MNKFTKGMDRLSENWGFWVSLLIIPMVAVVVYEVIMRKFISSPTTWGFDMTAYLYGAHFMLGMCYVMRYDGHIRVDAITRLLPLRLQDWLRVIFFVLLFIPFVGAMCYGGVEFALDSWINWERGQNTWRPPLYLVKTIIPVAFIMLMLQGVASFIKDIAKLKEDVIGGEE